MPYIDEQSREELEGGRSPETSGELNYLITKLCLNFINETGLSYQTLVLVTGVLSDVNTELNRRIKAKYEDRKIEENGDIEEFNTIFWQR